jgi:hypothetical protein
MDLTAADLQPERATVARRTHHLFLAVWGSGRKQLPPGAAYRAEIAAHQSVDVLARRTGVRQRVVTGHALVCGGRDVNPGPAGGKHWPYHPGDPGLVHPVERLGEGHHLERAQARWQILGTQVPPGDGTVVRTLAGGLGDHARVGAHPDRLGEQRGEQQGQRTGPAADVEQPPAAVEPEVIAQCVGQPARVRHPAYRIVRSAAGIQALVHATVRYPATARRNRPPVRGMLAGGSPTSPHGLAEKSAAALER